MLKHRNQIEKTSVQIGELYMIAVKAKKENDEETLRNALFLIKRYTGYRNSLLDEREKSEKGNS